MCVCVYVCMGMTLKAHFACVIYTDFTACMLFKLKQISHVLFAQILKKCVCVCMCVCLHGYDT